MTIDLVNNVVLAPLFWSVLSVSVLTLVQRSRNTAARTLHHLLFATLLGAFFIPLSRTYLPVWEWEILPDFSAGLLAYPIWPVQHISAFVLLCWLYLAVALLLWLRILFHLFEAYRLLICSRSIQIEEHCAICQVLQRRLGIKKTVRIRYSSELNTPVTMGFFRPYILMPERSTVWSADMCRDFFAHELAHIRRGDWLTMHLAKVLGAILWGIPTTWLLLKKLNWYAEIACDDCVVALQEDRTRYAQFLLTVSSQARPPAGLVGLIKRSDHFHRIASVLDGTRVRQANIASHTIYLSVLFSVLSAICNVKLTVPPKMDRYTLVPVVTDLSGMTVSPSGDDNTQSINPKSTQSVPFPAVELTSSNLTSSKDARWTQDSVSEELGSVLDLRHKSTEITLEPFQHVQLIVTHTEIPNYPISARQRGKEGDVIVVFDVAANGVVENCQLLQSSGHSILDRAALKAVKKYRYAAPTLNGENVSVLQVTETFQFKLLEDAK